MYVNLLEYAFELFLWIEDFMLPKFYKNYKLKKSNILFFAKKSETFSNMLDSAEKSTIIEHEMVFSKKKSKFKVKTNIALIKNVLKYDWMFATNTQLTGTEIVKKYRVRWNIETDFRMQDEARIKTKSIKPNIRLF